MIKKTVLLLLLFLLIFTLMGCSEGGKKDSSTDNPSTSPGTPAPMPTGGIDVYGYVFLGDTIQNPVGVKFTFTNQNNKYSAVTENSVDGKNYYRINNITPGSYTLSVNFSGSNLEALLPEHPAGYQFGFSYRPTRGAYYGFIPDPAGHYPEIGGSIENVEIVDANKDSSGDELLWVFLSPAQNQEF